MRMDARDAPVLQHGMLRGAREVVGGNIRDLAVPPEEIARGPVHMQRLPRQLPVLEHEQDPSLRGLACLGWLRKLERHAVHLERRFSEGARQAEIRLDRRGLGRFARGTGRCRRRRHVSGRGGRCRMRGVTVRAHGGGRRREVSAGGGGRWTAGAIAFAQAEILLSVSLPAAVVFFYVPISVVSPVIVPVTVPGPRARAPAIVPVVPLLFSAATRIVPVVIAPAPIAVSVASVPGTRARTPVPVPITVGHE